MEQVFGWAQLVSSLAISPGKEGYSEWVCRVLESPCGGCMKIAAKLRMGVTTLRNNIVRRSDMWTLWSHFKSSRRLYKSHFIRCYAAVYVKLERAWKLDPELARHFPFDKVALSKKWIITLIMIRTRLKLWWIILLRRSLAKRAVSHYVCGGLKAELLVLSVLFGSWQIKRTIRVDKQSIIFHESSWNLQKECPVQVVKGTFMVRMGERAEQVKILFAVQEYNISTVRYRLMAKWNPEPVQEYNISTVLYINISS